MTCSSLVREAAINQRLAQIQQRLADIAAMECASALAGGKGRAAQGHFDPERTRLIAESDDLLDEMEAIGGSLIFRPANLTPTP